MRRAMASIGTIIGAILYVWLGARSNTRYIQLALAGGAVLTICALLAGWVGPLLLYVGFLISGLFTDNLLSGFLNWVVGYGGPAERPLFVGLSNTIAAAVSLIAPFIAGTIAQTLGYRPLFVVALVMTLSALFIAVRYLREPPVSADAIDLTQGLQSNP